MLLYKQIHGVAPGKVNDSNTFHLTADNAFFDSSFWLRLAAPCRFVIRISFCVQFMDEAPKTWVTANQKTKLSLNLDSPAVFPYRPIPQRLGRTGNTGGTGLWFGHPGRLVRRVEVERINQRFSSRSSFNATGAQSWRP
jgi:hypothetical protein